MTVDGWLFSRIQPSSKPTGHRCLFHRQYRPGMNSKGLNSPWTVFAQNEVRPCSLASVSIYAPPTSVLSFPPGCGPLSTALAPSLHSCATLCNSCPVCQSSCSYPDPGHCPASAAGTAYVPMGHGYPCSPQFGTGERAPTPPLSPSVSTTSIPTIFTKRDAVHIFHPISILSEAEETDR